MPYKIRPSKKKETVLPAQKIKDRFKRLKEWFSSRPLLMTGVIASLLVTVVFVPSLWLFMRQSEDRAWGLEREASLLFHEKPTSPEKDNGAMPPVKEETLLVRLTKAAALYDEILDRYPASRAAVIAQFESGNVYFDLEKYDQAENRYLTFLKKETDRKDMLPLVHLRLAYLYQKKKNNALALDHFRIAYEWEGGFNKDQAGFERGVLLEKIGQKAEAIETYKKISGTFTDSPWGTEAKARLALLDPSKAVQSAPPATTQAVPATVVAPPATALAPPIQSKEAQKVIAPVPSPIKSVPKPIPVQMPSSPAPAAAPPQGTLPLQGTGPSTSVPIEITPEQLRLLREKGNLTIPLPKQPPSVETPPATESPEQVVPAPPAPATPTDDGRPAEVVPPAAQEHKSE